MAGRLVLRFFVFCYIYVGVGGSVGFWFIDLGLGMEVFVSLV